LKQIRKIKPCKIIWIDLKKLWLSRKESFIFESKESSLFRAKYIFLIVLFDLNILILYGFYEIAKFLLFWIHAHIIVTKSTLKIYWTSCGISRLVVPSIVSWSYSSLLCSWLENLFSESLIHCAFHRTLKRFNISYSSLTMIQCFIISQRGHKMKHSRIILSWNISEKRYISNFKK